MIRSELTGYDIPQDGLEEVEQNVEAATQAVFERHEVELKPEDEVIEAIQSAAAEMVIDLANNIDERTVEEQFGILREDVEDPQSEQARKTVYLILSSAYSRSGLEAIESVSGAIFATK